MPTTAELFPPIPAYDIDFASFLAFNRCDWRVDPAAAVLVIYDMQTWYVNRYADPRRLVANIRRLRTAAERAQVPVIFVVADPVHHVAERGIARDLWGDGIGAVKEAGAADDEMHPELTPGAKDFVILKRKYSAFFETDLEAMLRRMNRSQVIMSGNYANHGCMVTTVDAYMRNFQVFFMADALGATSAEGHEMALRWVADTCGQVALTTDVVAQLERGA